MFYLRKQDRSDETDETFETIVMVADNERPRV